MKKRNNYKIKIKHGNIKVVFFLFVLLNAIGYSDENNDKGMSPIRKRIRKQLSVIEWKKRYPQSEDLLEKNHPGSLLLSLLKGERKAKRTNIQKLINLCENNQLIKKLWRQYGSDQKKEYKEILPIFKEEVQALIDFVGSVPKNIHTLTLTVNPLDAYWRGYGLTVKGIGHIIIGPGSNQAKRNVIRHELIHILAPKIIIPHGLIEHPRNAVLEKMGYGTKTILNREYVVRALHILYEIKALEKDRKQAISEESEFPKIEAVVDFVETKIKRRPL